MLPYSRVEVGVNGGDNCDTPLTVSPWRLLHSHDESAAYAPSRSRLHNKVGQATPRKFRVRGGSLDGDRKSLGFAQDNAEILSRKVFPIEVTKLGCEPDLVELVHAFLGYRPLQMLDLETDVFEQVEVLRSPPPILVRNARIIAEVRSRRAEPAE